MRTSALIGRPKLRFENLLHVAAFAIAATVGGEALSATATGSFNVNVTIQSECRLASTSDLAFGTTGVLATALTATTTLGVQCTNTTPYNVGLDQGLGTGATVTVRKMTGPASATISYELFRDASRSQVWGKTVGTDTLAGTGNGNVQNLTVYGRIPAQTTPAAGTYTDTVQVTITY